MGPDLVAYVCTIEVSGIYGDYDLASGQNFLSWVANSSAAGGIGIGTGEALKQETNIDWA